MPDRTDRNSTQKKLICLMNPSEGGLGASDIRMVLFHQSPVGLSDHLLRCTRLQPKHLQSL